MQKVMTAAVLFALSGTAFAGTFRVGGQDIIIPSPVGFARVTPQMGAVDRLTQSMADPLNDQLAYFIPESDIPSAMAGEIPSFERYFVVKVNKKLANLVASSKDFAELKELAKSQNEDIFESVRSKIPEHLRETERGIDKEFDVEIALDISQMIPLSMHYETDSAFAYSMYAQFGVTKQGNENRSIIAATATFVNVSGKILYLYCYGTREDLEWTRIASKAWATRVIASNEEPPIRSSVGSSIDWEKVTERGILGAVTAGLFAALAAFIKGLSSIFKKEDS